MNAPLEWNQAWKAHVGGKTIETIVIEKYDGRYIVEALVWRFWDEPMGVVSMLERSPIADAASLENAKEYAAAFVESMEESLLPLSSVMVLGWTT